MRIRKRSRTSFRFNIVVSLLFLIVFAPGVFRSQAEAIDYYMSPSGSDSNSGTSASPWRTFSFAIPRLRPGDTLVLKNGTYNGYISISCGSNAVNGTITQPVTIKAEHERQALIASSSVNGPLLVQNCQYWSINGLRLEHGAISDPNDTSWGNIGVKDSSNITIKRNLVRFTNYNTGGSHGIYFHETTNSLIEENEIYSFHRWGIQIRNSYSPGNNIIRRNYLNARGTDLQGHQPLCLGTYPSGNNIFENNIIDNCGNLGITTITVGSTMGNNKFLGNIVQGSKQGAWIGTIGASWTPGVYGINDIVENHVGLVGGGTVAFGFGTYGINIGCVNCTFIHESSSSIGFTAFKNSAVGNTSSASAFCINCLSINMARDGFSIDTSIISNWSIDYPAVYNNSSTFSPSSTTKITNAITLASNELGSCKVFVPSSATHLKRKGKNAADIGANVLYRYENGTLTTQPLWNPSTGEFPGGAIVAGVNDVAGSSRFDVHKRLNVNTNGCFFPAEYGGTVTPGRPSTPINVLVARD